MMFTDTKKSTEPTNPDPSQAKPELKPPARSRIFAEQLEVDKQKSTSIYNVYQKDSLRMKIMVDENYLKLLDKGLLNDTKKVKIHADIEGIGPVFKINLEFTNQGSLPLLDLNLALQFSSLNYTLVSTLPEVKFLLPNILLSATFKVKNISTYGLNEEIRVFLSQKGESRPVAGAVIAMPVWFNPETMGQPGVN